MQVLQRKRLTRRPEDAPISQRKSSEAPKSIRKADRYTSIIYIQPSFKHQLPTRHFLFGYGSLINGLSRNRTLPRATKSFPVRVQGLSRTWSYPCPLKNYTAVSVEKTGCQRTFCNGVLIELDEAPDLFLSLLDARELNYRRSRIDLNSIVPYSYNKDSPKA